MAWVIDLIFMNGMHCDALMYSVFAGEKQDKTNMFDTSTTRNKELVRSWRSYPAWIATPFPSQASHLQLSPGRIQHLSEARRLGQVCYVHWSHVQRGQSKKESISISRRTQRVWSFGSSWRHMLATSGRLKTAIHSDTTVAHGLARNWQPAIHARVQLLQSDLIGPGAPVTWFSIGNHVSI